MFCALFLVVGIALAPVTDAVLARLARGPSGLLVVGFVFSVFGAVALVAVALGSLVSWLTTGYLPLGDVAPMLLAASVGIALAARFGGVSPVSYAAIGITLAVGIWLTGNAIVMLLR
jgi:hypothetical protein